MALNKLLNLKELKQNLKKLLKSYKGVFDIIIYGSYVKGKTFPKDIDICIILEKEDLDLIETVRENLENIQKISFEFIFLKDIYKNPLWRSLEREGFSVKNNKFLKDILGIRSHIIYTYELKNLKNWEKVKFSQVLNKLLNEFKGIKLGFGAIMVPREFSGNFIEFFDTLKIRYKVKWVDLVD